MITDPAVLFLDEPTSGLDSFQAQAVMESMKNLTHANRLIIAVIHQPRSSIYNMCDKLLLLSNGNTMYFGNSINAVNYFTTLNYNCPISYNPSDYFLDLLSPDSRTIELDKETNDRIQFLSNSWNIYETNNLLNSIITKTELKDTISISQIKSIGTELSFLKLRNNFILLCWRSWTEQSRDIFTIGLKLFFSCFFALLLGGIYSNIGHSQKSIQNRAGLLFFITINQCL